MKCINCGYVQAFPTEDRLCAFCQLQADEVEDALRRPYLALLDEDGKEVSGVGYERRRIDGPRVGYAAGSHWGTVAKVIVLPRLESALSEGRRAFKLSHSFYLAEGDSISIDLSKLEAL